jgi:hypothetical protein
MYEAARNIGYHLPAIGYLSVIGYRLLYQIELPMPYVMLGVAKDLPLGIADPSLRSG